MEIYIKVGDDIIKCCITRRIGNYYEAVDDNGVLYLSTKIYNTREECERG